MICIIISYRKHERVEAREVARGSSEPDMDLGGEDQDDSTAAVELMGKLNLASEETRQQDDPYKYILVALVWCSSGGNPGYASRW